MSCVVVEWIQRYAQINFPAGFASQGGLIKYPTVWLDGARPPPNKPKYVSARVAQKQMGENLKLVWAEFSTLSLSVSMMCMVLIYLDARPHLALKTRPRFSTVS